MKIPKLARSLPTLLLSALALPSAADDLSRGLYCTATARFQFDACLAEAQADAARNRALCVNLANPARREACLDDARDDLVEARGECAEQHEARLALCDALGQQRYEPRFEPALFDADPRSPSRPNPWFPLGVGNVWRYAGAESIVVNVLDKTKLIDGVRCIVVRDRVVEDGVVVEDTFDWYGQRKNGSVDYCGEISRNYELFDGDQPPEPELVDVDGSWKAGRDGDLAGTQMLYAPYVGAVYRQEFSPGTAEDAARVLAIDYGWGGGGTPLDRFVPPALAQYLCAAHDCLVVEEFTPLEPDALGLKYYARGVGLFLEVDPESGETVQLVGCNFDSRCAGLAALPPPAARQR
jgi:hypothetical protein